jgi:hypothetical protein
MYLLHPEYDHSAWWLEQHPEDPTTPEEFAWQRRYIVEQRNEIGRSWLARHAE